MSTIENLQDTVRTAVSNVDDIADELVIARENLDAIADELEEAVEAASSPVPPAEPDRVGDIVEITKATDNATAHVGHRATVIEVPGNPSYSIKVLLSQGFGDSSIYIHDQPTWSLDKDTYRVVARLSLKDNSRAYDYPEVS